MKISARVNNAGRFDSFIADAELQWAAAADGTNAAKKFRRDIPAGHAPGLTTWERALPAQTGFEFTIVNLRELDPGLDLALHEGRWAKLILTLRPAGKLAE
jgi:hypothetical protein